MPDTLSQSTRPAFCKEIWSQEYSSGTDVVAAAVWTLFALAGDLRYVLEKCVAPSFHSGRLLLKVEFTVSRFRE